MIANRLWLLPFGAKTKIFDIRFMFCFVFFSLEWIQAFGMGFFALFLFVFVLSLRNVFGKICVINRVKCPNVYHFHSFSIFLNVVIFIVIALCILSVQGFFLTFLSFMALEINFVF